MLVHRRSRSKKEWREAYMAVPAEPRRKKTPLIAVAALLARW
jgi:hypothetical protein